MEGTRYLQAKAEKGSVRSRLSIPTSPEHSADFKKRIGVLLGDGETHVYIDTSFLMWATKIGPASRCELLDWLRTELGDRVHVPTWAAHEYLRHHVAGTIVEELDHKAAELSGLVNGSFNYFRPFLDDPALPAAEAYDRLRASAREAINTFDRIVKSARGWRRAYPDHAKDVIEFINERVLDVDELFEDVTESAAEGAARYEGRVPPGFKDRNKKGSSGGDFENDSIDGANRYGDLIFWKEAIKHAQANSAKAIIILTNDQKNDWRMGGGTNANIDSEMLAIRKSWRPVPAIHPMLALEAKLFGIANAALLDSQYLAVHLRDVDEKRVASFADVAIVPDPPPALTEDDRRKAALEKRREEDERREFEQAEKATDRAKELGYRFADDPALKVSKASFTRALLASRAGADERGEEFLSKARTGADDYVRISDQLDGDAIAGMDQDQLARMARGLHDSVLAGVSGFEEALADLGDLLPELPTGTASAITLGLMASMYLETETGNSRIPPRSPIADVLFGATHELFGELPSQIIAKRLSGNDRRPLHIPLELVIECHFETEAESAESDEIRSLKISGVETLLPAQESPSLSLSEIFEGDTAKGTEIIERAARLFGLPLERLDAGGDESSIYRIPDGMGFKEPKMAFRAKKEL